MLAVVVGILAWTDALLLHLSAYDGGDVGGSDRAEPETLPVYHMFDIKTTLLNLQAGAHL